MTAFNTPSFSAPSAEEATKVVQFGNPGERGFAVTAAKILAIREDGLLLVEGNGYIGNAHSLWDGNRANYPAGTQASCTCACKPEKIVYFYGSRDQFFESLGFKGYAA